MINNLLTQGPLKSLRKSGYRNFWLSDGLMASAENMEFIILAWYMLIETQSPLLVGFYSALRFCGPLFAPFFGIIVDKYDRKKLLIISRSVFLAVAVSILLLSLLGYLNTWYVLILTSVAGMGKSFDNVIKETLLADLVSPTSLPNAVALTRSSRDGTHILAPIIGGYLLDRVGLSTTYILVTALHSCSIFFASRVNYLNRNMALRRGDSIIKNLKDSLFYAGKHEVVLALLVLAFLVNLTAFPLIQGLIPIFAKEALLTNSTGLGQLMGAYSAGALLASLLLASMPNLSRLNIWMICGSIGWHASAIALSQTSSYSFSIGVLSLSGLFQSFCMVTMAVLLLRNTSADMRGRIMGFRGMAIYGLPMGLLISGFFADNVGITTTLAVNGVVGIVLTIAVVLGLKKIWYLN